MIRRGVVALCLLGLAACSGSPNQRPKTHTTTTASSSSTAAPATAAATTIPATTTTAAALAKPCAAADLGVGAIQPDGASQHRLIGVELVNTSSFTCSLSGFPASLTAVDQDGRALEHVDQGAYQPDPPAGNVAPGEIGGFTIDTKTVCEPQPPPRRFKNVQIGLPGGGTLSLGDFVVDGACGIAVSKLGVRK